MAPSQPFYQIRVQGHIAPEWAVWFEGMEISCRSDGTTCLTGMLPDQAALHGVLLKICNLNLVLVSVQYQEKTEHRS